MMSISYKLGFMLVLGTAAHGKTYGSGYKGKIELPSQPFSMEGRIASTAWPDGQVFNHPNGTHKEVKRCVTVWNYLKDFNK